MQDVDWFSWAHRAVQPSSTGTCSRQTARLRFETTGASGGDFNSMQIICGCGAANTFDGLTNRPYSFKCWGRQPWEHGPAKACDGDVRVFPRAASNIYYPQTLSALDIAAGVDAEANVRDVAFLEWLSGQEAFKSLRQAAQALPEWENFIGLYSNLVKAGNRDFGLREGEAKYLVISAVNAAAPVQSQPQNAADLSQHGILKGEWPLLTRPSGIQSKSLVIRTARPSSEWPTEVARAWDHIGLVHRLKEVRALLGFRRVKPDTSSDLVPVDLDRGVGWLPGAEAFGEGIFLRFSEGFMRNWETRLPDRVRQSSASLEEKCAQWGRNPASVYASPRFIALHTFSHGLIRRLAFDAGYSASSLRERIYCDPGVGHAGILVYTSESDSEGSLGGLVRQGAPERLLASIERTIADLAWCSGDPVCSELHAQGIDGMNSAACHACCLVAETSCPFNNTLLDRRLVIGSLDGEIPGLLEHIAPSAS